ncbi:hypothetical protein AVEN_153225-1 [Araneus ventricosus]|uniref:USP domain-containing protein n=1 Tax=Araneus ventricosus TaxID=182803 RepID=A0A4Y2NHG3_ARAVE|nr:hypothetical protein AVEN_153225-1 [Araneus ventricosus]
MFKVMESVKATFSPDDIKSLLLKFWPFYSDGQECDVAELLEFLVAILHEELQTRKTGESFISGCFFGKFLRVDICKLCHKTRSETEDFSILHVPVVENATLLTCIEKYRMDEIIKDSTCVFCKRKVDLLRKTIITKLPPVLIVHLLRYAKVSN